MGIQSPSRSGARVARPAADPELPAAARTRGLVARLWGWLPRGGLLPEDRWRSRHRWLVGLLWAHAGGLFLVDLGMHGQWFHALTTASVLCVAGILAGWPRLGRRWRSAAAALGLAGASAILVHVSGGSIEAHFHFFVIVSLLSIYQDWVPFGMAVGLVVLHHGVVGTLDPQAVYNHPGAIAHPWLWAAIHGGALSAGAAASLVAWRLNEHQALHDGLTGLANRLLLADRVEFVLKRRDSAVVALVYVDLDDFKLVNDRFGHPAGDRVLVEAARRLEASVRAGDTVARIASDEFAVLLDGLGGIGEAHEVAERIRSALGEPYEQGTRVLAGGASVGLATTEESGATAGALLRDADLAMYTAKASGKGLLVSFRPPMYEAVLERARLEEQLRRAFDRGEFVLHYQPVVDLRSGRMAGVEALVRWRHPERGILPPGEFLGAVETMGAMHALTRWVLAEACRWAQARRLAHPGELPLTMAVNLTPGDLTEPGLVEEVRRVLADTGFSATNLCVEVTETAVVEDVEHSRPALDGLKALGVSVAVDDFGTGYSSLSHLRQLPVDIVKIDRSFVDGLGVELEDSTVVAAVVGLAHTLSLSVVAEGVETAKQLGVLRDLGCEFAQGYFLSKPLPGDDVPTPGVLEHLAGHLPVLEHAASPQRLVTVVIADDLDDDRRLLGRALERSGRFRVVGEAGDGEAAVELARRWRPDVVLLDVDMPGMDGLQALPHILAALPGSRVVLLSGHASDPVIERALAGGATAFFNKGAPDVVGELLKTLEARP